MLLRSIVLLMFVGVGLAQSQPDPIWIAQVGHGRDAARNFINTTFSFINLTNTTNRVEIVSFGPGGEALDLLRQEGSPFQMEASVDRTGVELAARGYASASSLNADPTTAGGIQAGWVQISPERPVAVEVLFSIFDAAGRLVTSTSVLPTAPTSQASAIAFARSDPPANTGVALLNPPGQGPATVQVEVVDSLGRTAGEQELVLQPGQRIARFLNELVMGLSDFSGTFELRADVPIVILPLRQEGLELTTQEVHPPRPMN